MKKIKKKTLKDFENWYQNLPVYSGSGGPAKGTVAGALVVLERLKTNFNLDIDAHTSKGGTQIKGTSGGAVKTILEEFGETRPFVSEGGRTNRGLRGDIVKLLDTLDKTKTGDLPINERNEILEDCQSYLVEKVKDFHGRQRLKFSYDSSRTTWQLIRDILDVAAHSGKEGPVAQYLVGAKLRLRFPNVEIRNESFSTSDDQKGKHGDFLIEDTVFHVTISPMSRVYEKCQENLNEGLRAFLLVPNRRLEGAPQNVEATIPGKVTVESVESFVSQNIEELSTFSQNRLQHGFLKLLETYNLRVSDVEYDKSMLIEIPINLKD